MLLQGKETPFDTELFKPVMDKLQELAGENDSIESRRIVSEHLRASMMIIQDGGLPSNVDRGYILRRLIRRMVRHLRKLQINLNELEELIDLNIDTLKEMYPELHQNSNKIKSVIIEEKDKFEKTLERGEREFNKIVNRMKNEGQDTISGQDLFTLYET